MQVDLFKNAKVMSSYLRSSKKIETRNFSIRKSLNNIDDFVLCEHPEKLEAYKRKLIALNNAGREYYHVGGCGCDNLLELELLGIGAYCKQYTVVIDFSDHLDYVLHRIYGCSTEKVRRIPNYSKISRAMLNYDFTEVDGIGFDVLFSVSDKILEDFTKTAGELSDCMNTEEQLSLTVFRFYSKLLQVLSNVKDYVITSISMEQPEKSFVYRSKSFSSSIASSDYFLEGDIILKQDGFESCTVPIRSYKACEWLKGRVF